MGTEVHGVHGMKMIVGNNTLKELGCILAAMLGWAAKSYLQRKKNQ